MKENSKTNSEMLFYKKTNGWLNSAADKAEIFKYANGYKAFLNAAKTEREFITAAVGLAEKAGFKDIESFSGLKPGDKIYRINRGKSLMLAIIGERPLDEGVRIVGAHVDAPRLDLKPCPVYEDGELCYLKTHYYGGIKKYQWTAIPLAIHGVVVKKSGEAVAIAIGDEGDDITFTITDLLPHLSREQMEKKLGEAIEGEGLNLLIGSIPFDDKEKEPVKSAVLRLLHEAYAITEEDFISAELEIVPAFSAKDLGFDRGLLAAAGQDDRVCAYTSLSALLDIKGAPHKTAVCLLVDKEEIGSMGNTGAKSRFFEDTLAELCALAGFDDSGLALRRTLAASWCLSADVSAGFDPMYPSVSEKRNTPLLGYGVVLTKYTGARGKSGSSDASAEFLAKLRALFDDNKIAWQTGELGKIDQGGGGTIAQFIANLNVDTIDCGVALLSMHSPFEVSSKFDIHMCYKAYKAFWR